MIIKILQFTVFILFAILIHSCLLTATSLNPGLGNEMVPRQSKSLAQIHGAIMINGVMPDDQRHAELLNRQYLMSAGSYLVPTAFHYTDNQVLDYTSDIDMMGFRSEFLETESDNGQEFQIHTVSYMTRQDSFTGTSYEVSIPLSDIQGNCVALLIHKALDKSKMRSGHFRIVSMSLENRSATMMIQIGE